MQAVVVGADAKSAEWVRAILKDTPYSFQFHPVNVQTSPATTSIVPESYAKTVILMEDLLQLQEWTRQLVSCGIGPVLWGVTKKFDEQAWDLAIQAGSHGIVSSNHDRTTVLGSIKMAMANWQRELAYRKKIEKALTDLEHRKTIEKAKGLLMDRLHLTESEAFGKIRSEAMCQRKTMAQIAESILLMERMTGFS
ncbi:ANTAR domain-containing response regulator [Effusibacillus dendaii]|uniref:ANTAR domain-containing protein n=1 Tax=Effusibacillus dendaii TaxID=2743772 RepID=A0A7I8DBB9_9BACL|nr:ANTAR domain-containing protein [Effusibacillus dendaii]BCJ85221.1 hypothetical protein skT53_02060 [Effusibacillus dendaii]